MIYVAYTNRLTAVWLSHGWRVLIASEGEVVVIDWISRLAELHHDRGGVFRLYVHRFRPGYQFVSVYNRPGPAACDLPHSRVSIRAYVRLSVPESSPVISGLRTALHICCFSEITRISSLFGILLKHDKLTQLLMNEWRSYEILRYLKE